MAQIAASIREFGWTNPVLVDGDNGIIAGHGRLSGRDVTLSAWSAECPERGVDDGERENLTQMYGPAVRLKRDYRVG